MDEATAILLADGLHLPSPAAPVLVPPATQCAMTGATLTEGHPIWSVVPSAAGEFLELLPCGQQGYVSDAVARLFAGTWNLGSRVICACGLAAHPLISRENATKEQRPCWSDLVRDLGRDHLGHTAILICTTDFKKRLWPQARATTIGETTSMVLYDTKSVNVAGLMSIHWPQLIDILDRVEWLLDQGATRRAITTTLSSDDTLIRAWGMERVIRAERAFAPLRRHPAWPFVLTIAQAKEQPHAANHRLSHPHRPDAAQPS